MTERRLVSIVPDPEQLLSLEPEELAGPVLNNKPFAQKPAPSFQEYTMYSLMKLLRIALC